MKVAALYDIHGNLPALEAVLTDLGGLDVDLILVGGDIVWGPMPFATLTRLQELGSSVAFIRGNADREVAERHISGVEEWVAELTVWCADRLTPEQLDFLGHLPETYVAPETGIGPILFCHGSPRSDEEKITPITPNEEILDMLAQTAQGVVVCGHTHMQFDRDLGARRVVNPGSVGLPYEGMTGAFWALIGDDVELRHTAYDMDAAATAIRASGCPDAEGLAAHLLDPPTQQQALLAFGS